MYLQKARQGTFLCTAAFVFYNSSTGKEDRTTLNVVMQPEIGYEPRNQRL